MPGHSWGRPSLGTSHACCCRGLALQVHMARQEEEAWQGIFSYSGSLRSIKERNPGSREKRHILVFVATAVKPTRAHRCHLPTWAAGGAAGWELGPCFWVATSEEQPMGCSVHWQTFRICKVGMRRPVLRIGRVCVRPAEITQPVTRPGSGYGPPRWRMQH